MKAFKVSVTAVYNNDDIDQEQVAKRIFESMKGDGLVICNVDKITRCRKGDEILAKTLENLKRDSEESK